jgi:hypothetical protein
LSDVGKEVADLSFATLLNRAPRDEQNQKRSVQNRVFALIESNKNIAVLQEIRSAFEKNCNSVFDLLDFEKVILHTTITELEALEQRLAKADIIKDHPTLGVGNTLKNLKNIQAHGSLGLKYKAMFNQCLVLLVSYLEFAMNDLFRVGVGMSVRSRKIEPFRDDQLTVKFSDLSELIALSDGQLGDLIIEKKGIGFQNAKVAISHFKKYFSSSIPSDHTDVNNVIAAQACRHVIVHNAAVADEQSINQMKDAQPRTIKPELHSGGVVQFEREEVRAVGDSMKVFFKILADSVVAVLASNEDKTEMMTNAIDG